MKIAVFAHYDKNNIIEDYVIFFLQELSKHIDKIIFVSDSNLQEKEIEKIKTLANFMIIGEHGEYDFGSYKRGYFYSLSNNLLDNCDELIFVNDSCYAPIYPFDNFFEKMHKKSADFWGATQNCDFEYPHVQSYFIAFNSKIFLSEKFKSFMSNIQKEQNKLDIIKKYEIGLSRILREAGFQYEVYSDISKNKNYAIENSYLELLEKEKFPFIKRSLTLFRINGVYPIGIKNYIKNNTNYNYNFILQDIENNANPLSFSQKIKFLRKQIFRLHLKEKRICLFGKWYNFSN